MFKVRISKLFPNELILHKIKISTQKYRKKHIPVVKAALLMDIIVSFSILVCVCWWLRSDKVHDWLQPETEHNLSQVDTKYHPT